MARTNRQWRAIDRKISTDYNGKLSCDAFFFAINFEERIANMKAMAVHREKNVQMFRGGLPKLHAHIMKLVGNL